MVKAPCVYIGIKVVYLFGGLRGIVIIHPKLLKDATREALLFSNNCGGLWFSVKLNQSNVTTVC